jgi:hypothetical protein
MDGLGLSATDLRTYMAGLCSENERRIVVEVQSLTHTPQANLTAKILDGQISVDRTGSDEVSRVLTMRFLDPYRRLDLDPNSPGDGAMHFDRMIRIRDQRWIPALNAWVTAYPFVGPIWEFERNGSEVSVTAHSKERISMGSSMSL